MPPTRVTGKSILNSSITDADIATANKDGLPATPSLRTLGQGPQQAAAGDDVRLGFADNVYRQSQLSGSSGPRYYTCGQVRASGGTPTNAVALDTLFLMPIKASNFFVLRAAGVANTNSPAGCTFNVGLYDSIGPQDIHPNSLLLQLGVSNLSAFPVPFSVSGLSVNLAANQVYWLAVVFSGVAPNCRTLNTASADPILGHSSTFAGAAGIGWQITGFPAAFLPSPLPAATPITSNGTPHLKFGV